MRTGKQPYNSEGGIVALARLTMNLTQRELAERSGVPQATIARIEAGLVSPRFATLTKILAGAGLEMRIQLAPYDDHDKVLEARYNRLSTAEKAANDESHLNNLRMFKEAGQKAGLDKRLTS